MTWRITPSIHILFRETTVAQPIKLAKNKRRNWCRRSWSHTSSLLLHTESPARKHNPCGVISLNSQSILAKVYISTKFSFRSQLHSRNPVTGWLWNSTSVSGQKGLIDVSQGKGPRLSPGCSLYWQCDNTQGDNFNWMRFYTPVAYWDQKSIFGVLVVTVCGSVMHVLDAFNHQGVIRTSVWKAHRCEYGRRNYQIALHRGRWVLKRKMNYSKLRPTSAL